MTINHCTNILIGVDADDITDEHGKGKNYSQLSCLHPYFFPAVTFSVSLLCTVTFHNFFVAFSLISSCMVNAKPKIFLIFWQCNILV